MKKYFLVAGLMMVSAVIFAQRHHNSGKHPGKHADRMKKELSLNDDQYNRIKTIDEKFILGRTQLRADTALTVGTARLQMKRLAEEHQSEINGVLTPDQLSKWTALKAKQREDRKKKWGKKSKHG